MEGIFEAILQFLFELVFEIIGEIIGEIIEGTPEILDICSEKLNLPFRFSGSSSIIKLNLFE